MTTKQVHRPGYTVVFEEVSVSFGERTVLHFVSCEVPAGEITVILGMSGAGKSVMMRLALGLLTPDRGRVLVDGKDLARLGEAELIELRASFGVAFQGGALFTSLDVFENIAFPLREHLDLSEDEIASRVGALLRRVGMPRAARLQVGQLSGGMTKRVAFARALALDPRLVFLDEPSSGLDPVIAARVDQVILRLHEQVGGTYLVISHDIESARTIAGHVGLLHQGKLIHFGPAGDFWDSQDPMIQQLLERSPEGPLQHEEQTSHETWIAPIGDLET